MPPGEQENLFVEIAVEKGYVTPEEIDTAVEDRDILSQRGIRQELAEILVSKGLLSREQREEITRLVRIQTGEAKVIGDFEIVSKLGSGGMGVVYRAKSRKTGDWVALKVLPPSLAADTAIFGRFQRETRILQKLQHPNVVGCVEAGFDEERKLNYCAMELVEGQTLAAGIKAEGLIPEREALLITMQIAQALQHAHFHGLVHRDVKPGNIMVMSDGTAKLLDMGLARDSRRRDGSVTVEGVFVGSPFYASPEQVRGEDNIDIRSDIYSLGATLYHLVTGRTPFEGPSSTEILGKHLTEEPAPASEINPNVGMNTSLLIQKMMAKDRADRYQVPKELLADISVVLQGRAPAASKSRADTTAATSPADKRPSPADSGARTARRPGTRRGGKVTTRAGVRPVPARSSQGKLLFVVIVLGLGALSVTGYFVFTADDKTAPRRPTPSTGRYTPFAAEDVPGLPSSGVPTRRQSPVEEHAEPLLQPEVTLSPGTSRPPVVPRAAASPRPVEGGKYVLVDFERSVGFTSKYGQPAQVSSEAAHSGRNGMMVKVAPGMNNHQASRIVVQLPNVEDFSRARGIELFVKAEGSGGNRAELGLAMPDGEVYRREGSGGGWMFYYRDGEWERHYFDFTPSDQLKRIKEILVYFNHMARDGPFTFYFDDIALIGYGEGLKAVDVPVNRFSSYAALPRHKVSEPIKKYAATAGNKEVLFAATFDDGHEGFFGGERVTGNAYGGTPGAYKAYCFPDEQWFPCKIATDVNVHSPKNLTHLFKLEPGTRIRVAIYLEGSDFVNVQFWDMQKNGNYYVRTTGVKQGEWSVLEVDPLDAVPTARDGTSPEVGDHARSLGFYSGYKVRDCTFIVDEICVVSGRKAASVPARPIPETPAVAYEAPPTDLLAEFESLVDAGRFEEARDRMHAAAGDPVNAAHASALEAAASVAEALAGRSRTIMDEVRKLAGHDVTIATTKGLKQGKVASVSQAGMKMSLSRKMPGMGTVQMSYTIAWADLTPEAERRFAASWKPEGADGAIARVFVALADDDEEAAKAAFGEAENHPLAVILRRRLGISPLPEQEEASSPPPPVEPGWDVILDNTISEGWETDAGGRIEGGVLVAPDGGEFRYKASWEDFEVEWEMFFESNEPTVIAMVAFNQYSKFGTDNRVRMSFHGDGDAHFKDDPVGMPLWKSGVGGFPPKKWTKVRVRVTRNAATIWRDGKEVGRADVSQAPVVKGGISMYAKSGFSARFRNVRVKVVSGE